MKHFWPELAVLTLGLLLAAAVFADPQVGCQACQNGRCAVPQQMPVGPPPVTAVPTQGDTSSQPGRFPVVKKVVHAVTHPFGGRFRR